MRIWTYTLIMGIGFTIGLLCGLLVNLPVDTLPASQLHEGHELGRIRRAANTDDGVRIVEGSFNGGDGVVLDNTRLDKAGGITPGSASKQILQSALHRGDYPPIVVGNPVANPLKHGANNDINPHIARLPKYKDNDSRSVVYVNPAGQKLVLDNNVNKVNDTYRSDLARGLNQQFDNPVVRGETGDTGHSRDIGTGQHNPINAADGSLNKHNLIKEGIFWGPGVEAACPKGFSEAEYKQWRQKANNGKFVKMEVGCGRMQNRKLYFHDSEKACVRYRLNIDQIQGEIYSFYLSKLLGINNVVPSTLHLADSNLDLWRMVGQDVANAQWSEEKPLIVSEWIKDLTPAFIPQEFRNLSKTFRGKDVQHKLNTDSQSTSTDSGNGAVSSLCDVYQWSDLIVFDYLTGNLDRVVNNLFNLQWNDRMMSKPAHNLERDPRGNLVFIDNESGLFHGYRLLEKYSKYHDSLLHALCVFKESTIRAIRDLVKSNSLSEELQTVLENNEPLHRHLPKIPGKNIKILEQRMLDVLHQVDRCSSQLH